MGKRKRIKELEQRCENLEKQVHRLVNDTVQLQKGMSTLWSKVLGYDSDEVKIGVPTPGVWRIKSEPDQNVILLTYWWFQGDDDYDADWVIDEKASEYLSLIEAVRVLEKVKSPKGYHKPVIVEPSGGIYNEKDGKDMNAKHIEPKVAK